MGNWNVTLLNGKEQELVWESEQYYLDVVIASSAKCCGSDTVELNEGWNLFYSGVNVTMFAQAEVGIFVSPRLSHCVTDWIPLVGRVCLFKLRLQELKCGCKSVGGQMGGEKRTAWWNQEVKEAIRAEKIVFRA